jgi:hypothetical protein
LNLLAIAWILLDKLQHFFFVNLIKALPEREKKRMPLQSVENVCHSAWLRCEAQ